MDEIELIEIEAASDTPIMTLTTLLSKVYEEQIAKMTKDPFLNQKATRFILAVLSKQDGLTQNDLVRVTHMKGSTISVTLSKLEEDGIVTRKNDVYDMRCSRVYLTEKGYDLAKYRLEILKKLEQNAKKDITPKELRDATYVLETFLKNLMENKNKAWLSSLIFVIFLLFVFFNNMLKPFNA